MKFLVPSEVCTSGISYTGGVLRISKGTQLLDPLCVFLDGSQSFDIVVSEGASLKIVEKRSGKSTQKIVLEKTATLEWIWWDSENDSNDIELDQTIELFDSAEFKGTTLHLGCGKIEWNSNTIFCGPRSRCNIISGVLGKKNRRLKFRQNNDHRLPDTYSNLELYSVMKDESQGDFAAMIHIAESATRSEAYQKNKNLMLSRKAQVLSMPQLEIETDDVKCAHGASVSALDENQLYYLQTRGISKAQSEQMIVAGVLEPIRARAGLIDPRSLENEF
jgi:Fe-S cluster assembly protein SufD